MLMKLTRRLITIAAAATGAYLQLIRPWHERWGATDEENQRPMPGDEEVQRPMIKGTRAVTIEARPEEIWPWLVQIGTGRAGWYSYDWIENRMGLDISSTNRIIPEFQRLEVGDTIPLAPGLAIPVKAIKPNESLLLVGHDPKVGDTSWVFGLYARDERHTRLVIRAHVRWPLTPGGILCLLVTDPGSFLMVRKMLLGIKLRAEQERASKQALEQVAAKARQNSRRGEPVTPKTRKVKGTDRG